MIGQTVSHYRIVEEIGHGGMGVVYKAEDTKLGGFVALKFLPQDLMQDRKFVERFHREARATRALNHSNICTIYDIDEAEGVHYIAMKYVQGKTLDQLIARHGLRVHEALKYAVQMATALVKSHAAGIVHRDLKPTNVMVTGEGLVKVLDFGLAKRKRPPNDLGSQLHDTGRDTPSPPRKGLRLMDGYGDVWQRTPLIKTGIWFRSRELQKTRLVPVRRSSCGADTVLSSAFRQRASGSQNARRVRSLPGPTDKPRLLRRHRIDDTSSLRLPRKVGVRQILSTLWPVGHL